MSSRDRSPVRTSSPRQHREKTTGTSGALTIWLCSSWNKLLVRLARGELALRLSLVSPKVFCPFCHRWSFGSLPLSNSIYRYLQLVQIAAAIKFLFEVSEDPQMQNVYILLQDSKHTFVLCFTFFVLYSFIYSSIRDTRMFIETQGLWDVVVKEQPSLMFICRVLIRNIYKHKTYIFVRFY